MRSTLMTASLFTLLGAGFALAQDAAAPSLPSAALSSELFRVPLGPAPGDTSKSELFAARESYKVRLDGQGFELHPFLGPEAPRSLPLSWRTRRIAVGTTELPLEAPAQTAHAAWDYALHRAGFSEHYELEDAGLAMSWVFHVLPLDAGDLVIEGEVRTPLRAEVQPYRHGGLVFADDAGNPVLSFGAAIAFDGAGRWCEVATRFDGESLSLRLDGAWLRSATLPVTVDPLVGPTNISVNSLNGGISSLEIGVQRDSAVGNVLIAFTRAFSATDHDAYAAMMNEDFAFPTRIYSDTTGTNSDKDICVAYVGGADRWMIAHQRDYTNATGQLSSIRLYFHGRDDWGQNTGTVLTHVESNPLASLTSPDLGGSTSDGVDVQGLLVYQRDYTSLRANTSYSEVVSVLVDAAQMTLGAPFLPGVTPVGTSYDRETPAVNQECGDYGDDWLVVWSEWDHQMLFLEDWDLIGARTRHTGTVRSTQLLEDAQGAQHFRNPRVAGEVGDYALTYEASAGLLSTAAVEIRARRLNWWGALTLLAPARTLLATRSPSLPVRNGDLSCSTNTRSHWVATYGIAQSSSPERFAAGATRLGGTCAPIERAWLIDDPSGSAAIPAVSYDYDRQTWLCAGGFASTFGSLLGFRFDFAAGSGIFPLGNGCGSANAYYMSPQAGNTAFASYLMNAPANRTAIVLLSLAAVDFPLDGFGLFGCRLFASPGPELLLSMPLPIGSQGSTSIQLSLPDLPLFQGDFVMQWIYENPGVNPLGLQLSDGALIRVR